MESESRPREPEDRDGSVIRTFLIADLRGYTTLSDAHGDQAAADVAERFLAIARECVDGAYGDGRRGPRGRGAGGLRLGEGGAPRGARDPGGRRRGTGGAADARCRDRSGRGRGGPGRGRVPRTRPEPRGATLRARPGRRDPRDVRAGAPRGRRRGDPVPRSRARSIEGTLAAGRRAGSHGGGGRRDALVRGRRRGPPRVPDPRSARGHGRRSPGDVGGPSPAAGPRASAVGGQSRRHDGRADRAGLGRGAAARGPQHDPELHLTPPRRAWARTGSRAGAPATWSTPSPTSSTCSASSSSCGGRAVCSRPIPARPRARSTRPSSSGPARRSAIWPTRRRWTVRSLGSRSCACRRSRT